MRTRSSNKSKPLQEEELVTFIDEGDGETQCSVCAAEFLDEDDLKLHVQQMHANETQGNTMCSFCGTFFSGLEELVFHFIYSHLERLLFCFYCYRAFRDVVAYQRHKLKHYKLQQGPTITCSHCPQVFPNRYKLQKHEFTKHRDSDEGVLLNHTFSLLSCALNVQITKFLDCVSKNKPINCAICNHHSSDVTNYIEHLKITNCQGYTCDKCCRVYKTVKGLANHFKRRPKCQNCSGDDKRKQCLKCDKYIDSSNVNEHKATCQAEKCSTCKVVFNSVHELTEHRVKDHEITTSVTIQTCKFCSKELVGTYNLQKHINRAHKNCNLYKYVCSYCGALYMHPRRLFGHYFSKHKDIQPYTCKICDMTFRLRKKFTIHIKMKHNSVGFVEFDEKLHVIFSKRQSEKPCQPHLPVLLCDDRDPLDNDKSTTTNAEQKDLAEDKKSDDPGNSKDDERECSKKDMTVTKTSTLVTADATEETTEDNTVVEATDTTTQSSCEVPLLQVRTDLLNENEEDSIYEKPLIERIKRKAVTKPQPAPKRNRNISTDNTDTLSVDLSDDEPLSSVRQSLVKPKDGQAAGIGGRTGSRRKPGKLTCKLCNKYCYTFQNYHHHMSLHERRKLKRCIKCHECFRSQKELQFHMDRAHSSSKLTETLKSLLEKRKQSQQPADKSAPRPAETLKSLLEQRKKIQQTNALNSVKSKFRQTIKKVVVTDDCTATITPMSDHGISVKNFIENFRPDKADTVNISNSVTIKTINEPVVRQSLIKMYQFHDAGDRMIGDGKLCFPVKFKDTANYSADSKGNVSVKLVQQLITRPRPLNFIVDDKVPVMRPKPEKVQNNEYCNTFADPTDYTTYKNDGAIPDVGHEVVMGHADDVPKTRQLAQEIIIPNIPEKYGEVRIGHLLPEAPFYKIVKIKKLLQAENQKESDSDDEVNDKNIQLPDGTQLVTVKNPFSHLIPNEHLEEILKAYKNKYYTPKYKNIGKALVRALNPKKKAKNVTRRKTAKSVKSAPEDLLTADTTEESLLHLNTPEESVIGEKVEESITKENPKESTQDNTITEATLDEDTAETVGERSLSEKAAEMESGKEMEHDESTLEEPFEEAPMSEASSPVESMSEDPIPEEPIPEVSIPGRATPEISYVKLSNY